jgi:hypothetical protein
VNQDDESPELRAARQHAIENARIMLPRLLDDTPASLVHWSCAVGFLSSGSPNARSQSDVLSLLSSIRDLPNECRAILLWRPLLQEGVRQLVITRRDKGEFHAPALPTLGPRRLPLVARILRIAARSDISPRGHITLLPESDDLSVFVARPEAEDSSSTLVVRWWASSERDDYAGSTPFDRDDTADAGLVATIQGVARLNTICMITDTLTDVP